MPYANMEQAKKAGAKTELGGIALSLTQINKMAEMADAMKAEGKVDNPWAVVIANFQRSHKIENGKWVKKTAAKESMALLEKMSLDDMRRAIGNKLDNKNKTMAEPISIGYSYTEEIYDDGTCIVRTSKDGAEAFFQYKYSFDKDGNVTLTNPQKVERTWAKVKESQGAYPLKKIASFKQNIHETISLSEGQVLPDEEGGKKSYRAWWPLLKEGPGNKVAKNYYSKKAIESLVPIVPIRNKMFVAHAEGDVKPQERSPRDWVGSIRETKIENGMLFGLVQAVDPWLKEKMYDCPQDLAASIEARGRMSGTIQHEGEAWNLIEEVKWLNGFMVVDYPGNAPMGVQLTEADLEDTADLEETMENMAELKEKFPEIYNQVVKEVKEADKAEFDKTISAKDAEIKTLKDGKTMDEKTITDLSESVKKMDAKLDGLEALGKKKERDQKVFAEMGKLPKEAVTDKFKALVEEAKDEKSALEMIEERAKLFEGKVLGHGKVEPVDAAKALKEREAEVLHSMGQKTAEEIEAAKKK